MNEGKRGWGEAGKRGGPAAGSPQLPYGFSQYENFRRKMLSAFAEKS